MNRRQMRITGGLAILAILVAVLMVWLRRHEPTENAGPTTDVAVEPSNAPNALPEAIPAIEPTLNNQQADRPPLEAGERPPAEEADGNEIRVVIRMMDTDGAPVPRVGFEYVILPPSASFDSLEGNSTRSARLDDAGLWQTSLPSEAASRGLLLVRLSGDDWRCVRPAGDDNGATSLNDALAKDDNVALLRLTRATEQYYTLTLLRANPCSLVVEYEDGQPFEGKVTLSWFTTLSGQRELAWRMSLVDYEPSMRFPATESTTFGVSGTSARPGFEASFVATPAPEELRDGLLRIVIAADDDRVDPCGLILVHNGFRPDQVMDAFLVTRRGFETGETLRLDGPGETRTAHVRPGAISCMAIGDGVLWSSGVQVLEPGEWRRVTVDAQPPAGFTVTVKNETGEPIGGAVVSAIEVGAADWRSGFMTGLPSGGGETPRLEAGTSASELTSTRNLLSRGRTDSRGRLEFRTWAGTRQFRIEAKGYESRVIECTLRPDTPYDYGEVALEQADASMKIRITTPDDAQPSEFALRLNGLSEGAMKSDLIRFGEEDTKLIENVPAGRYQIWVMKYPGGGLWWRNIELERRQHEEVVIDLTRDHGRQED